MMMMGYTGFPGRYVDVLIRTEIENALREAGVAPGPEIDAAREQDRRADLNDEMARAALGGGTWDFVTLLAPEAAVAGPSGGVLTRLARRLGLLSG